MNGPDASLPFSDKLPALLVVLAGPAGSGKTTLCERLVRECPNTERVVTATTRPPREGEKNGRDYFFQTEVEFDHLIKGDAFFEWAHVHEHRYGTPRQSIGEKLARDIDLCLSIDVQGVASLRRAAVADPLLSKRLVTVFIMPPSLEELRRRLRLRAKDDEAAINLRMETALREVAEWTNYDFCIHTRSRDDDFAALRGIVGAEKRRVSRLLA